MDSIKPGMFINDRYEIIDKVGSGGMANVYKAKCHRLNRYVAIKVLKSEFSSDTMSIALFKSILKISMYSFAILTKLNGSNSILGDLDKNVIALSFISSLTFSFRAVINR